MDSIILQRLLSQLTPEQVSQLLTEPEQAGRGGMTNPRLMALMRMAQSRQFSDSAAPNRNILRNQGLNMSGAGVIMPPTAIPNAYGGQLQGRPRPDAPEIYMPGQTNTWLRGT